MRLVSNICTHYQAHVYFIITYARPKFLRQRATPVIVGWIAGRTWQHNSKWYTQAPKLLRNF
jgi:hypothetical protein